MTKVVSLIAVNCIGRQASSRLTRRKEGVRNAASSNSGTSRVSLSVFVGSAETGVSPPFCFWYRVRVHGPAGRLFARQCSQYLAACRQMERGQGVSLEKAPLPIERSLSPGSVAEVSAVVSK